MGNIDDKGENSVINVEIFGGLKYL